MGDDSTPNCEPAGDPPDFTAARDHVLREVGRFVRKLRVAGADVPATPALPASRALVEVGLDDRERVRAAMRATLIADRRDAESFSEAFPAFWYRLRRGLESAASIEEPRGSLDEGAEADDVDPGDVLDAEPVSPGTETETDGPESLPEVGPNAGASRIADASGTPPTDVAADGRTGTFSPRGRREQIGDETIGQQVDRAAVKRLERALASLAGRRWSRSRTGETVDARRALRESLATGGVAASVPTRERDRSELRACVLADVSRSVVDAVDRAFLLGFVDALVDEGRSVRAFFFDTDIREVTDAFDESRGDPADALDRAAVEWGGGTRIGDSLGTLRRRWPDAVDRRTATLIVSDGLDVGEVDELERNAAWLARRSGAVVWLNPLAASPEYEPTCRGMAAALPYADGLFAFAGNDDLAEVARQLRRRGPRGPIGYEHDFRDRTGGVQS